MSENVTETKAAKNIILNIAAITGIIADARRRARAICGTPEERVKNGRKN